MSGGIYRITNLTTGRFYIGSAVNFARRKAVHLARLRKGEHGNTRLQRDWDRYGPDAFEFKPIVICAREHLLEYEQRLIDGLEAVTRGYNMLPTAGSALGFRHSDEHRASLKGNQHARGLRHSAETREHLSQVMRGNRYGAGWAMSEAHRQAVSSANRGRKQTPEQIAKRVAATQATKAAKRGGAA